MTDYWLNKLIFDLQGPDGKDLWTNRRAETIDSYPVTPEVRQALLDGDIATLQPLVNPYLMRFFLLINGYDDAGSIAVLGALHKDEKETANG